jgi:Kef-type K+ transport system membrane component KefB
MTATSVGIPARVWQSSDALKSNAGERFLDVAEMDDLSGVIFIALLFAVLPELQGDGHSQVALTLSRKAGWFVTKFTVFGGLCYLFSRYLEQRVTDSFRNIEADPDPMLAIVGLGLAVAAAAGLLGFSVAIGAFLAGLVFSRDPHRAKVDTSFSALYNLFTPFFFVGVGLEMDPSVALSALGVGGVLLAAAVVGKLVGTMLPAWRGTGPLEAAALGVSMVPRAEITMLIMQRANSMGPDVLPPAAYGAMVLVCAASCLLVPPILARLIPKIQSQR